MDIIIFSGKFLHGFDVRKNNERVYTLDALKGISGYVEEIRGELLILRLDIEPLTYMTIADKTAHIDKVRKFVNEIESYIWGQ